jgi:hypothetical protein
MKTITDFTQKCSIPEGLIRAVVHQVGGWERFKAIAIQDHSNKWPGFEYHTETIKFFNSHRDLIRQLAHQVSLDCGRTTIEMVRGLRCLSGNFNEDEIGGALYGPRSKINTQIANALALFVLDKVVQAYSTAIND